MFEVFGNMDTAEEINMTAKGLLEENDFENLKKLAEENGIPQEMVEAYKEGEVQELADVMTAAIGKLLVEEEELKPEEIMKDWTEYIKAQCFENDKLAAGVRRKSKSLKECMGKLLEWSFKNAKEIDSGVKKAAGINANVKLGIPGNGRAKKIIRDYYLAERGEQDAEKKA